MRGARRIQPSKEDKKLFTVSMPFQDAPSLLGDSMQSGSDKFFDIEQKFSSHTSLTKTYSDSI